MFIIKYPAIILFSLLIISCGSSRKVATYSGESLSVTEKGIVTNSAPGTDSIQSLPRYGAIQIKYAYYLNVDPSIIRNGRLYNFIDKWLNTPYKWGGNDANGIDCSAFLQRLLAEVYTIQIPRTSVDQFFAQRVDRFKSSKYLSEGDLVFFRTMENKLISHVGLYLHNNMFVNSSSSKGVSIASLNDPYWKKHFVAAGRLKVDPIVKK